MKPYFRKGEKRYKNECYHKEKNPIDFKEKKSKIIDRSKIYNQRREKNELEKIANECDYYSDVSNDCITK